MTLRVLTYNIWDGGDDRLAFIRDLIRTQQPDMVALEEANDRAHVEWLASELGMALYHGEANSDWHIAWLSRLPVAHAENHKLPIFSKTLMEIDVEWDGEPLQLFATHLDSNRTQEGEEHRAAEVRAVLQVMRERGGTRQLLVGDFNDLAPQAVQPPLEGLSLEARVRAEQIYPLPRLAIPQVLEAGYFDSYQIQHPNEQGYTFKSYEPVARFDYIFAAEELAKRLQTCDRVTGETATKASDHLPVWAEFA